MTYDLFLSFDLSCTNEWITAVRNLVKTMRGVDVVIEGDQIWMIRADENAYNILHFFDEIDIGFPCIECFNKKES